MRVATFTHITTNSFILWSVTEMHGNNSECVQVLLVITSVLVCGFRCVSLQPQLVLFFIFKEALHSSLGEMKTLLSSMCMLKVLLESGSSESAAVIRGYHKVKHPRKQ